MFKFKLSRKHQKGVTLFEVLLVLFVAAFIAAAVATIYNRVNLSYKQNTLFTAVQQLAGNIQGLFGNEATGYTGLTSALAFQANLVPPTLGSSDSNRTHPFSTSPGAWSLTAGSTTYTIVLSSIPKDVCATLANNFRQIAQTVTVGSTPVTSAATAAAACNGTTNNMTLIMR